MALVPFRFPILDLPSLAIQQISDYWDPFEIYNFSKVSRRSKAVAKSWRKKVVEVRLCDNNYKRLYRVVVSFTWSNQKIHEYNFKLSRKRFIDYYSVYQFCKRFIHFSKNPVVDVLKLMEEIVELFKYSKISCYITNGKKVDNVALWLNWIAESRLMFTEIYYEIRPRIRRLLFEKFPESIPTQKLSLDFGRFELNEVCRINMNWPDQTDICKISPHNFHFLYSINSPRIRVEFQSMTKEDLNSFLKSWRSGLTHSRLEQARLILKGTFEEWNDVMEGVAQDQEEPRFVNQIVKSNGETFWMYAEIDIFLANGRKATIQLRCTYDELDDYDAESLDASHNPSYVILKGGKYDLDFEQEMGMFPRNLGYGDIYLYVW